MDPATTSNADSDEWGIVAAGHDGRDPAHFYILEDESGVYTPDEAAKVALQAKATQDREALVEKTLIGLVSDMPQQRGTDASYGLPANWQRKRQAIIEVAAYRGVLLGDVQGTYPINMALEPSWSAPTDKVTNNGNIYLDGLHENEVGHQIIADHCIGKWGLN